MSPVSPASLGGQIHSAHSRNTFETKLSLSNALFTMITLKRTQHIDPHNATSYSYIHISSHYPVQTQT
jgi:hypothetical protein